MTQTTPQIFTAMSAVMRELDAISKGQRNQQQGFNYRGIDDVYNALHPLLAKHGIICTPEVLDKSREERTNQRGTVLAFTTLRIRYTFWAQDGSSVSCTVEGEGMDSGDKSSNKAMAVAHKYALLQTFCIPTEDMPDPDAEVHAVRPKVGAAEIRERIAACTDVGSLRQLYSQASADLAGSPDLPALQAEIKARGDALKSQTETIQ